jgi:Zn-dependent protease with chaperone function
MVADGPVMAPIIPPVATASRFDRVYEGLGAKLGAGLLAQLKQARSLRPRFTLSGLLALGITSLVHGLTLLLLLVAIILFRAGGLNWIYALIFLGLVWILRPRVRSTPSKVLERSQYPALYGLAHRVSEAAGARPIDGLLVTPDYNAFSMRGGWRGHRFIGLGLPLLAALDGQERAALLGHEVGHAVNGDLTRGLVIGTALESLGNWYYALRPDSLVGDRGLAGYFAIPFNLLLLGLSQVAYVVARAMIVLLYRTKQRAEYQADHLAAIAGGTASAIGVLEKFALARDYGRRVGGLGINSNRDFFREWRELVGGITPDQLRQRLDGEGVRARIDATHPPTLYRVDLLQSRAQEQARVVVSASESAAIDKELATLEPAIKARLADLAADRLYY